MPNKQMTVKRALLLIVSGALIASGFYLTLVYLT